MSSEPRRIRLRTLDSMTRTTSFPISYVICRFSVVQGPSDARPLTRVVSTITSAPTIRTRIRSQILWKRSGGGLVVTDALQIVPAPGF